MCQRTAPKAPEPAPLISEVDNSNSVIHLNVQATYVMGIVSTVFLVCILFFLLCMCCGKKCKKLRLWCCNGCTSTQPAETGRLQSNTPWGAWQSPAQQPSTQLQTWQDPHQAARQHCKSLQGPLSSSSAPDPSWTSGGVYPSVPHCPAPPHNSPNSSAEDI
jgi:hypothetical protein